MPTVSNHNKRPAMYAITFPQGKPTSISKKEEATVVDYYQLLDTIPYDTPRGKDPHLSLIVAGSGAVGKKAILDRHYCGDPPRPLPHYESLEHCGYRWCSQVNNRGCVVSWELASDLSSYSGHLRGYQNMKEAVRDSHACLLVYDVSSRASLNNMLGFHNDIQHELSAARSRWRYISGFPRYHFDCKKKPVFVLANKVDLPTTSRAVTECEGRAFAASIGAKYCETSVKEDIGITEAIHTAITCALIHCAEIEIPELKEAEAKRFNERMKASKARMKEIYPYTYFLRRCRLDDTARGDTRALKLPRRRLLEMKSSAKRRR